MPTTVRQRVKEATLLELCQQHDIDTFTLIDRFQIHARWLWLIHQQEPIPRKVAEKILRGINQLHNTHYTLTNISGVED